MLNPHFVAGVHGLFGGHKSEDIRTFLYIPFVAIENQAKLIILSFNVSYNFILYLEKIQISWFS